MPKRVRNLSQKNRVGRRQEIAPLVKPHGVSKKGIAALEKEGVPVSRISSRLRRLQKAGVPMGNLASKLRLPKEKFDALVARFRSKHRLTAKQRELFDFLRSKRVSEKTALAIAKKPKGRQPTLESMKAKIAFLESIKLDPKKYGAERIPVQYYEPVLGVDLNVLRRGVNRRVLWALEDDFAAKRLDRFLPDWRTSKVLQKVKPSTILKNYQAAVANGVLPTPHVLGRYSPATIRSLRVKSKVTVDEATIRHKIRQQDAFWEPPKIIRARELVVDALLERPFLAANRGWLGRTLKAKQGIDSHSLNKALETLIDWGVISRKNGFVRISMIYRTSTSGPAEHKAAVRRKVGILSAKARAREARKRAKRTNST